MAAATFRIRYITSPHGVAAAPKRLAVESGLGDNAKIASNPKFWRRTLLSGIQSDAVAFQLGAAPANRVLPITVSGSYKSFTAAGSPWINGGVHRRFRLRAVLGNNLSIVSDWHDWANNGTFRVVNFRFPDGVLIDHAFRVTSSWTWTMESQPGAGLADVVVNAGATTAIEMFILVGDMDALFANGKQKAELLRWMVPLHAEFTALTGADAYAEAQHRYVTWLTRRLFHQLPTSLRLRYDAELGVKHFCSHTPWLNPQGAPPVPPVARFELTNFLNVAARNKVHIIGTVNCQDLATFVQVCCKAYGHRNDNTALFITAEIKKSPRWGYVPDGQLWGWPEHPRLNNPFFMLAPATPARVDPRTDNGRKPFASHFWTEWLDGAVPVAATTVIDLTHAIVDVNLVDQHLSDGRQTRQVYLNAGVDPVGPPPVPPAPGIANVEDIAGPLRLE